MTRTLLTLTFAAAFLAAPAARAADHDHMHMGAAKAEARTVAVEITDDGVVPDQIQAKAGETVKLAFTRKTDATCIKAVVQADLGIQTELPLNKTVVVEVTPKAAGKFRILCGMGMRFATLTVN